MNKFQYFISGLNGTQAEKAKLLGISQGRLSQLIHGNTNPSYELTMRVYELSNETLAAHEWKEPAICNDDEGSDAGQAAE